MKKYNLIVIIGLVLVLSSCRKVTIAPEFSTLKKETRESTHSEIIFDNTMHTDIKDVVHSEHNEPCTLSKKEVVSAALQNNPELQADFQNLGIAKSDLMQAGLYTNPSINSVFRFPTHSPGPGTAQTNIETVASMRLSDLWQVPLAKDIAQDLVEMVSMRIFSNILTIVEEAKMAYDACLAAELRLKNMQDLLMVIYELRDEIYYRQSYGYTSDLDKDVIDAKVSMLESELKQQEAERQNTYTHLKKVMGLEPSSSPIVLSDMLYDNLFVPDFIMMQDYALAHRPEIHIALLKIKQYEHTIRLEKAKIFKIVDIGIGFKQDFDKPFAGVGPFFGLDVPIFDDNYVQVARAEFLLKQAELELEAEKLRILESITKQYAYFEALKTEIEWYTTIVLPSYNKAIDYAYTYAATMQLNMITALESRVQFHEAYALYIDKLYHAMAEYAHLERAIGKNFELFKEDYGKA